MRLRFAGILFLLIAFLTVVSAAPKLRVEDVGSKLACYCGTCPHLVVTVCGCGTAEQIKIDIQKMIDSGMTEKQIIDSYVDQYGQTVLAAPPKTGFNLTAWLLPFFAFFVGGAFLFKYLRRQQQSGPSAVDSKTEPSKDATEDHYRELLQQELEQRK